MAVRVGPFVLGEPLGRGGSGRVWRARHRGESLDVAIKIVEARKPEARAAFRAEVHAVAALDHPNVVRVHDAGELTGRAAAALDLEPGSPWLAMELAERTLMAAHAGLDWPARLRVLEGLLSALAHAHARGMVHRDVKPGNVLLGARSAEVVVADFGLAWALGRSDGADASGTPPYMAPEQILADVGAFGPWTDLYAVGCVAWLLATGAPPFGRISSAAQRLAHLRREPPPLPRGMPDGFEAWVRTLLRKDPRARFQRAADAAWALGRIRLPDAPLEPVARAVDVADAPTVVAAPQHAAPAPAEERDLAPPRAPIPQDWRPPVRPPRRDPRGLVVGTGLVGVRDIPLVGRRTERDALWADLLAVARGEARAVVLRGPEGRGRRRLVRWLAERAHEVGAAEVFAAEHHPIQVAGDGVRAMVRLPEDAGPDAILAALTATDRVPVALLYEVQWSGEAVQLVEEGLRRGLPILWVLTCRDEDVALPDGVRIVELPPLPDDDHRALLQALLPLAPALAARLEERTRGQPAWAVQLLRAWIERGWLARRPGGFRLAVSEREALVPDLAGVWQERIERLLRSRPASDRKALEVAAALGVTVVRSEWREACQQLGLPAPEEVLETLSLGGLADLEPDVLRFRQPAVIDALLARARDQGRLAAIHRACGRALAEGGEAAEVRVAQHLVAGEAWEEAEPLLRRVSPRAAYSGRHDVAAWALDARARALRALGVPADDVRAFHLDCDRADAARAGGDYAEAERLNLRAIELARRHGHPASVALSHQGMLMLLLGRNDEAEPWLRQALDEALREGDDRQRAYTLRALARVVAGRGRVVEALAMARESLALAGDPKGIGYSHLLAADLLDRQHRYEEVLEELDLAIALFAGAGMTPAVAQARQHRGNVLLRTGDLDAASRDLELAMEALVTDGHAEWYVAATYLGWVELLRGRVESAERLLARAEEQIRRTAGDTPTLSILLGRLVVASRRARWEEWQRLHDAVEASIAEVTPDPRYLWLLGQALKEVGGDPERAWALGQLTRRLERRLTNRPRGPRRPE